MPKFDKKAYAKEVENLTLESIQDTIGQIDERTYTDLHRREVLLERRTALATALMEAQNKSVITTEHWSFELTQQQKVSAKKLSEEEKDVYDYILEKHPEILVISKTAFRKVCAELKMSPEDIEALEALVCINMSPTVKANPIRN